MSEQPQKAEFGRVDHNNPPRTGQQMIQAVFGMEGEKAVQQYIRGIVRDAMDENKQEAQ